MKEKIDVMWAEFLLYDWKKKIPEHKHDFFHCVYVVEGVGDITIDGEKHRFNPGHFYITGPDVCHSFWADEDVDLKLMEVKFMINDGQLQRKIMSFPKVVSVNDTPVYTILKRIRLELAEKKVLFSEIIALNIMEIFTIVERNLINKKTGMKTGNSDGAGSLSDVISYMYSNLNREITLQELADRMHHEKSYFLKKFKKKFKCTPIKYANMLRIEKAKELLIYSDKNITQIADALGYNSIHHFSSQFKKFVGISPKVYVDKNKDIEEK